MGQPKPKPWPGAGHHVSQSLRYRIGLWISLFVIVGVTVAGAISCAMWIDGSARFAQRSNELMSYYCAKPREQRQALRSAMALPAGSLKIDCANDPND